MEYTVNYLMKFLLFLVQLIYTMVYYVEAADGIKTSWIRSGYWLTVSANPAPDIDSSLFTHLYCGFAGLNSTTYHLSIPPSDLQYFASFTSTVKRNNPSIQTLLSIGDQSITPTFLSMISNSSSRKSFINSSIQTALSYGFNGLDICCFLPNTTSDSINMAKLFNEWRSAVDSSPHEKRLILSMGIHYLPTTSTFDHDKKNGTVTIDFPVEAIQRTFDWVHMMSFDYFVPQKDKFVHPHAALYDPYNPHANTEYGLNQWISKGLPANKILIGMPYHGWVWTLLNPKDNQIGAPASGPGITSDGSLGYRWIKSFMKSYAAKSLYNSTYVENTCSFGSFWVGFDDVEAIKTKVLYAKKKGLRGYNVFQVANDDNWVLSQAAADIAGGNQLSKRQVLVKVLIPAACICCFSLIFYFLRARLLNYARSVRTDTQNFSYDSPDVKAFSFKDINTATDKFSFHRKLGEGGYGPVYKGKLKTGQEIAVKRLSKASSQGFEQFKNEVMLTARLQHVNLVKVMGFCVEREEKMLIYEYLPNSSFDFYLFDPVKSLQLDWGKRAHIIEGIIQGLLYLQEYSRLTIIHRDLKASNILLDKDLNPKISDFGMARIFQTDEYEANTSKIVGTYGYVPPEYVKQGVYSRKHDVYSFGVLLLQIISGKRNNQFYGANEEYNLLEYAYELWKEDEGKEFVDPSLDDSNSKYKLMRCMQVALLCVQEKQEDRPSMLEISAILNNKIEHIMNPKRPAFSTKPDAEPSQQLPCSQHLNYSNTDSVLSELEPR
ncbi:ephrin type-B receptor 3-like [Chenopodium quinoa]|uniref:ephrin type-B receptor 3-like n=1 Tax=Chenopodium quinoa TaxID=63459 RepID=UPI000B77BA4E|nr:ephrin type-B receptor 3-like [Chenopodium quinoa]